MKCDYCLKPVMSSYIGNAGQWERTAGGGRLLAAGSAMCGKCAKEQPIIGRDSLGLPLYTSDLGIIYP